MPSAPPILVCFATKEEAAAFRKIAANQLKNVRVLLTGMGRANAERTVRAAVQSERPALVLSSGFAGGLDPHLQRGMVVGNTDNPAAQRALDAAGVLRVNFTCTARVAVTAAEKTALRVQTGADAVEMESEVILEVCRAEKIPAAVVRAISDAAGETLPLDFNALMTAEMKLSFVRLALSLVRSPGKIPTLARFGRDLRPVSVRMAKALSKVVQLWR